MHPFSVLALAIFVAGYITARWDLVTRLYELAIFAWDHGVVVGCTPCAALIQCLLSLITRRELLRDLPSSQSSSSSS
jgi:phosphatidylinositol glycan class Q protein